MSHRVNPAARLRGELRLPGDKSISHRALLFAALAEGETLISGAGDGHDVRSTAGIIRALGATCERLPAAPDDAPGTARWRVLSPGRSGLAAQGDGEGATMSGGAPMVGHENRPAAVEPPRETWFERHRPLIGGAAVHPAQESAVRV